MDSCNTAHDQPKAARFPERESNGRHRPQVHTREDACGQAGAGALVEDCSAATGGSGSKAMEGRGPGDIN